MGNITSSAKKEAILVEARKLIARAREEYPLPEPDEKTYHQERVYHLVARLEEHVNKSFPSFGTIQDRCEQLSAVLDVPGVQWFYDELFNSEVTKEAQRRIQEDN